MWKKAITIILVIVILSVVSLGIIGYISKSNSQSKITAYLERRYDSKGRFSVEEVISDTEYIYHDNERDINFYAKIRKAGWGDSALFPIPHTAIYDSLNRGIMYAKREQAVELAQKHGLMIQPIESIIPDAPDKDYIYVNDYAQLEDAAKLFIDLFKLYELEAVGVRDCGVRFIYCESLEGIEEQNDVKILKIITYNQLVDGTFENIGQLSETLKDNWRAIEQRKKLSES